MVGLAVCVGRHFLEKPYCAGLPAHVAALLIATPVFMAFALPPDPEWLKPFDPGTFLLSVLLVQGWSDDPLILFSGNPAAWTLTCEMFFYALHPLLMLGIRRLAVRGSLVVAAATVAGALAFRAAAVALPDSLLVDVPVPLTSLPQFVLGVAVAWALRSGWRPSLRPWLAYVALATLVVGTAFAPALVTGAVGSGAITVASELIMVACAGSIVAVAVRSLEGRPGWLAARPVVKLGEWSFAFYLVHATFIYLALRLVGPQPVAWQNALAFASLLVVGLLAAIALHTAVERPLEKAIRDWRKRHDARRSASRPDPVL